MMQTLRSALPSLRAAVLSHARVPVALQQQTTPALSSHFLRGFAADAGTYLDKKDVTDRVISVVKNFEKVDPAKVTPASDFAKDLGLDSLDVVEVVMAFEEEFQVEIPDSEADKIASTADAIAYIASNPQAK